MNRKMLLFYLSKKYTIGTYFLISINFLLYFITCFKDDFSLNLLVKGPSEDILVSFGAKENGLISLGQIYRFFFPFFCTEI